MTGEFCLSKEIVWTTLDCVARKRIVTKQAEAGHRFVCQELLDKGLQRGRWAVRIADCQK
jgi:hypothetical protein